MKVGLVHGRFQPFHNGHKFLVDEMLKECDLGVVLIGAAAPTNADERNPFSLETRKKMIRSVYGENSRLFVGANVDLDRPHADDAQWDVLLASCVLSLTGYLPTTVYVGNNYGVYWTRVAPTPKIRRFGRVNGISASGVRGALNSGDFELVQKLVPVEVLEIIANLR